MGNGAIGSALDSGSRGSWFEPRFPRSCLCSSSGQSADPVSRRHPVRDGAEAPCPRSPTAGGTSLRRWAVRVRIAPGTLCPCSSPGRAASLYLAGSRFDSGRGLLMGGRESADPLGFNPRASRFEPGRRARAFVAPADRASPRYGEGRAFESRRRLHVTVVSAVSTRPRQGLSAGSNPVGHS